MTQRECGSVAHRGSEKPMATVAIIYHDSLTNGGLPTGTDAENVQPGDYATTTAYLCAACAASPEITNPHAATLIRTITL
jgi:hypothetical protein